MRSRAEQLEIVLRAYIAERMAGGQPCMGPTEIAETLNTPYVNNLYNKAKARGIWLRKRIARKSDPKLWDRNRPIRIVCDNWKMIVA